MTRSKVKVTELLKFWKLHFSRSTSSDNVSGQMTTDSCTTAQHLNLIQPDFFTFVPLFVVSRDLELGGVPAVSSSTKKFFRFQ